MTQILIKVLEQNPNPSFHDLMSRIGHSLHEVDESWEPQSETVKYGRLFYDMINACTYPYD